MNNIMNKFWMALAIGLGILSAIGIIGITYAMIFEGARVDFLLG